MDIGPSLHDLRTERNTYISNLQKNGTGGNDGLECVTMTSGCEPDVFCDSNERCEHYVIEKTCGKCHMQVPRISGTSIFTVFYPGVQSCTKTIPLLAQ